MFVYSCNDGFTIAVHTLKSERGEGERERQTDRETETERQGHRVTEHSTENGKERKGKRDKENMQHKIMGQTKRAGEKKLAE